MKFKLCSLDKNKEQLCYRENFRSQFLVSSYQICIHEVNFQIDSGDSQLDLSQDSTITLPLLHDLLSRKCPQLCPEHGNKVVQFMKMTYYNTIENIQRAGTDLAYGNVE